MSFIEVLKAQAQTQAASFYLHEIQKALHDAERLFAWNSFDGELFDLPEVDTIYIQPILLPVCELLTHGETTRAVVEAAGQIQNAYEGIHVAVSFDEENFVRIYVTTENVSIDTIETVYGIIDDEDEGELQPPEAPERRLSLVPGVSAASAPAQPEAPVAPVVAPAVDTPDVFEAEAPDTFDEEPLPEQTEQSSDAPELVNLDMLTIEQLDLLDVIRRDENAVAFIRANLSSGVEQFDSYIEFADLAELEDGIVTEVFELYEIHKDDGKPETPAPAENPLDDEPDEFFADVPEDGAERTAPLGQERAPAEAEDVAQPAQPVDENAVRHAALYASIDTQMPNDTATEINGDHMLIVLVRDVPNEVGGGSKQFEYNLRVTIRYEMFGGVKMIDKYRLYNGEELLVECASQDSLVSTILSL